MTEMLKKVIYVLRLAVFLAGTSVLINPGFTLAQTFQEIRIGSSNVSFTNFAVFYARDRKFFEKEGLSAKIIIVERGLTDKPLDPDQVVDFSFVKELRL